MAFIYAITNQINNKQYVGKTERSSISEAGRILNINHGTISKACRGVCKTAGGYK